MLRASLSRSLSATMTVSGNIYEGVVESSSGAYKFFLNGQWQASSSGKTVKIINPSTNQPCFNVQGESHEATLGTASG